ncbi:MAG: hypothetical protein UU85_C0004G0058 [Candidatus Wolfebacteria bacterium GW2011_GWA2_42_10]|uniref:Uncharacterized protein n=2 Tax=Candidatus Wolfeibacteriota TaxID=1752735 RepID=A0A0G0XK80_9BACT|nr:MAG: hypothetical protein UU38_C0001G0119 [Candidatus Wolfebacteria bacterium GW2011_GWB1_41_12]KKS25299.1 MAG: hypothetical protein UU85_C0004G0058 [Candidatus Wolfebacteria bacterium GW2011_GWA2_42_10]KKT56738.1 MAG: hypothetical protein UW50_C0001G0307 [Candidatus Wolfebacteria bacterium GW2011_GWA1_44_24]
MNDKAAFFFSENEFVAKEKLEIVKERGEPRSAGRAAPIQAGESLPPQAAKCVRTNSRILHQIFFLEDLGHRRTKQISKFFLTLYK